MLFKKVGSSIWVYEFIEVVATLYACRRSKIILPLKMHAKLLRQRHALYARKKKGVLRGHESIETSESTA